MYIKEAKVVLRRASHIVLRHPISEAKATLGIHLKLDKFRWLIAVCIAKVLRLARLPLGVYLAQIGRL